MRTLSWLVPLLWAGVAAAGTLPPELRDVRATLRTSPKEALATLRRLASTPEGRALLQQPRTAYVGKLVRAAFSGARTQALLERKRELAYLKAAIENMTGRLPRPTTPRTLPTEELWCLTGNADKVAEAFRRTDRRAQPNPSLYTDSIFALDTIAKDAEALREHLSPAQQTKLRELFELTYEQDIVVKALDALRRAGSSSGKGRFVHRGIERDARWTYAGEKLRVEVQPSYSGERLHSSPSVVGLPGARGVTLGVTGREEQGWFVYTVDLRGQRPSAEQLSKLVEQFAGRPSTMN